MRIRFIKDHKVQQNDGQGPHYRAGEVHDFAGPVARTYALKYIDRGYAVEHAAEPVAAPAPVEAPAEEQPAQPDLAQPDLAQPEPPLEQPAEVAAPRRGRRPR